MNFYNIWVNNVNNLMFINNKLKITHKKNWNYYISTCVGFRIIYSEDDASRNILIWVLFTQDNEHKVICINYSYCHHAQKRQCSTTNFKNLPEDKSGNVTWLNRPQTICITNSRKRWVPGVLSCSEFHLPDKDCLALVVLQTCDISLPCSGSIVS